MRINVEPIATVSGRINEIRQLTERIINDEILPNENMLWATDGSELPAMRLEVHTAICSRRSDPTAQ